VLCLHAVVKGAAGGLADAPALVPDLGRLLASPYLVVRREAAHLLRELARGQWAPTTHPEPAFLRTAVTAALDLDGLGTEQVKSLGELVHACFADPVLSGLWPLLPLLLPRLLAAHHSDEIEMQLATRLACRRAAWLDACPSAAAAADCAETVARVAGDATHSVHVRKLALEVLGLFYSRNYVLFDETMCAHYQAHLLTWLGDAQLDVREAAGGLLTALLHTRRARADALAAVLSPRLRALVPQIKSVADVPARHAAVLQAAALILCTPYRMPAYAPPLLLVLTRFLPDRAAVQATVRRTFGEFKRTHMDSWAAERLAFSEEELDAISELLVSPSYYA
jgi:proteasome activator subunit 4